MLKKHSNWMDLFVAELVTDLAPIPVRDETYLGERLQAITRVVTNRAIVKGA